MMSQEKLLRAGVGLKLVLLDSNRALYSDAAENNKYVIGLRWDL